jgi:uncharacterized membrane protein YgcG
MRAAGGCGGRRGVHGRARGARSLRACPPPSAHATHARMHACTLRAAARALKHTFSFCTHAHAFSFSLRTVVCVFLVGGRGGLLLLVLPRVANHAGAPRPRRRAVPSARRQTRADWNHPCSRFSLSVSRNSQKKQFAGLPRPMSAALGKLCARKGAAGAPGGGGGAGGEGGLGMTSGGVRGGGGGGSAPFYADAAGLAPPAPPPPFMPPPPPLAPVPTPAAAAAAGNGHVLYPPGQVWGAANVLQPRKH